MSFGFVNLNKNYTKFNSFKIPQEYFNSNNLFFKNISNNNNKMDGFKFMVWSMAMAFGILFGLCFVGLIISIDFGKNKIGTMKEEITIMKKEIAQENAEMKEEMTRKNDEFIGQIAGQKVEFDKKMRKLEGQFKESLANLTKPNDENGNELDIKFNSNSYKWNVDEKFGRELNISADGLIVKHSGLKEEFNFAIGNLPIPKFNLFAKNPAIIFYYEVEYLRKRRYQEIAIGFCDKQFASKHIILGRANNSIGIYSRGGGRIDDSWFGFVDSNEKFNNWDIIGLGIFYSPAIFQMEFFATFNGKLLGKTELPPKYDTFRLFPAANLFPGQAIRTNFGNEQFRFNPFLIYQKQ